MLKDKLFENAVLIEDDQAHALLIKRALRDFVEHVTHFDALQHALEGLKDIEPDIIITDLNLPDTYGTAHVEKLKSQLPRTPIVVLTSSTALDDAVAAMKRGAHDFIVKNFERSFSDVLGLSLSRVSAAVLLERERSTLQRQMEALRLSIENSHDGLAVYGSRGGLVYANSSFHGFIAITQGNAATIETLLTPRVARFESLSDSLRKNLAGLGPGGSWNTEIAISGERDLAFELSLSAIRAAPEAEKEYVLWIRDIREQKRRERFQKDLLATTTHDLKGPLGAITISSDLLVEQLHDRPRLQDLALRISSSASSSANLIDTFLNARRIQEGAFVLKPVPVDLRDIIGDAVEVVEVLARAKGVSVIAEPFDEPLIVIADRLALVRVLTNLATNAIKFTPRGGRVSLAGWKSPTEYGLRIADTGSGMEPVEVQKLFRRFSRLERHGSVEGTGIGLFVVKAIITAHGGKIEVTSTLGEGTTFEIVVPGEPPVNERGEIIVLDFA